MSLEDSYLEYDFVFGEGVNLFTSELDRSDITIFFKQFHDDFLKENGQSLLIELNLSNVIDIYYKNKYYSHCDLQKLDKHLSESEINKFNEIMINYNNLSYNDIKYLTVICGDGKLSILILCLIHYINKFNPEDVMLIIDEIECRLNPKNQFYIIKLILDSIKAINNEINAQLFISTKSPMIMASLESIFLENDKNRWFHLSYINNRVNKIVELEFKPVGDVSTWLINEEPFNLKTSRNFDTQALLDEAGELLEDKNATIGQVEHMRLQLCKVLDTTTDNFMTMWRYLAEKKGLLKR